MLRSRINTLVFVLMILPACTSPSPPPDGADAGVACHGNPASGAALVRMNACANCHGADLGGNPAARAPNLTPAGLLGWTEDDIARALALGLRPDGEALCASMPRYARLSEEARCDIGAHLRALATVAREVADTCN